MVIQALQQKRRCHAKAGGYCQRHQLSNHMGQVAPGSKAGTTDNNMSHCNLLTSERLGPDTCAFVLSGDVLKQQSADVIQWRSCSGCVTEYKTSSAKREED